ncbi:MAG: phospho-sugar mutase, partial [Cetobacterium sp.]
LMNYILENKKDIPKNGAVISTVVSTPMLDAVAKEKGVEIFRTLTGFKFIGEKIREFEEGKYDATFLMGFEESYGYLVGTHARDKDAVVATLLIAEMAAYYASVGSSIPKELKKLYDKFGYYREGIIAVTKKGKDGVEAISKIMSSLRENVTDSLIGQSVISKRDFNSGYNGLPKSDVIQFVLEDNTYITARPSGTEPKIKYYFCVVGTTEKDAEEKLAKAMESFEAFVD